MKKIFFLFLVLFLTKGITTFAQCGVEAGNDVVITCGDTVQLNAVPKWVQIHSGTTSHLRSVYFTDTNTGYAVGGSNFPNLICKILKTTDGGSTWIAQTSGTNAFLLSVYFINADTGYAVGSSDTVLKTTDGGINWTALPTGTSVNLGSVFFTDANTGYCVGTYGTILKTIDGGTNWTQQISNTNSTLSSVNFTNDSTGYVYGSEKNLKTSDAGATWDSLSCGMFGAMISINFTDADTGYAVVRDGTIIKTTDGGINWTVKTAGTNYSFISAYFTDVNTTYMVGVGGKIFKTNNAGTDWIAQASGTNNNLWSVYFTDANTGYAVGENETILKLNEPVSYSWSPANGLSATNIANPVATVNSDQTYIVTTTTADGCIATDSITIFVNPITVSGSDININCGDSMMLNATTNYTGTDTLSYAWSPSIGLGDSTIANPYATGISNMQYIVSVTSDIGCAASDTVTVNLTPLNNPEICLVGVDSTNKNMLVWDKPASSVIDSFFVYRETNVTNVYQKIGAVSYNSLSVFVDTNSFPDVQANKYQISIKDNCGLESNKSAPHKTMHLTIGPGIGTIWNLGWEAYEGFAVSTYNIYRGTNAINLQLIGTTSGSNTSYSDLTAPSGFVYYQIEVVSPNSCNPSKSYNSSRSNISTNNPNGIYESSNASNLFTIYPNPASDIVTLKIDNRNLASLTGNEDVTLNIYNVFGSLVKSEILKQNKLQFTIGDLNNGVYMVTIKSKDFTGNQRLIIQR